MDKDGCVTLSYIGCGCNKSPQVMDWGDNNIVCFGACNVVALYEPALARVTNTFVGHKGMITAVKWIRKEIGTTNQIVSASTDSSVLVWSLKETKGSFEYDISVCSLLGHKGTVHAVDGIECVSHTIVASAGIDNTVRLWLKTVEDTDYTCIKVIELGSRLALCVNMFNIPKVNSMLLLFGTDLPEIIFYSVGESEEINELTRTTEHEDWVRSIDTILLNNGDIFIASSSQDMTVRISRLTRHITDVKEDSFVLKKKEVFLGGVKYFLSLETVIFGHEGWVYSVHWLPLGLKDNKPSLLTGSFDRTLVIWKPCPISGVWLEEARMGGLGGDSTLGYYGAKFSPDGLSVLAHSYLGSFHKWKINEDKWISEVTIGGHSDAVMDIAWEPSGRYVISVSSDKTSRLHTPILKHPDFLNKPWLELSRPQIHGHTLSSISTLRNLSFATCSEEKVVRVFSPPFNVIKLLNTFGGSNLIIQKEDIGYNMPYGASITALGLSNKANFSNAEDSTGPNINSLIVNRDSNISNFDFSLDENFLVEHTVWPEVMKLYGHGNDVFCIAASNNNKVLATAAKATSAEQAKIILWDTDTWNILQRLEGHLLTVTQMSFSPDDTYLLSVSRDRKWCLYKKNDTLEYELYAIPDKTKLAHSRIIWSCCWSHDGLFFATASRDCKVIIWKEGNPLSILTSENGSVTAVDFAPQFLKPDLYIVAVGHDSGHIDIYSWSLNGWILLKAVSVNYRHHYTVQRLRFRPVPGRAGYDNEKNVLQLASCSVDHSIRIFDIHLRGIMNLNHLKCMNE